MTIDIERLCRLLAIIVVVLFLGLSQANAKTILGKGGFMPLDRVDRAKAGARQDFTYKRSKLQQRRAAPADANGFRSLHETVHRMSTFDFSKAGYRDRRRGDDILYEHQAYIDEVMLESTGDAVTDTIADLYGLTPVDDRHPFLKR